MALRKIFKEGEPVLQKKAKTIIKFDARLSQLVGDMTETLKDANGVGLAAPQVGVLKRLVVIDAGAGEGVVELINPEITKREGVQNYYEGCLSYPGYYGNVGRPEKVTVRALDAKGNEVAYEASGLYAVACCHEADHLEGEMFMKKVKGPLYTLEEVKALREEEAEARSKTVRKEETRGGEAPGTSKPDGATPDDGYMRRVEI